jgi:RNA polymerase sigma-70 factor (ECF subfamily)
MRKLVARLARGEDAAFAELYDSCADRLHHYVAVRLGSCDAAADVVQTAFLRAVKSRRRFRGVENPVAYMFQIARNETTRAATENATRALPIEQDYAAEAPCGQTDDAEIVTQALERLDSDDREVVELKINGGLTFREISEVTGLPQGTVSTRYRRALESLRGWLTKQYR